MAVLYNDIEEKLVRYWCDVCRVGWMNYFGEKIDMQSTVMYKHTCSKCGCWALFAVKYPRLEKTVRANSTKDAEKALQQVLLAVVQE